MWSSDGFHKGSGVAEGLIEVGVSVHIYGLALIGRTLPPKHTGTMPRGRRLQQIPREDRARRLGQEPLEPGEASEPVQVRAREGVLNRFKDLSTRERGQVVALGLSDSHNPRRRGRKMDISGLLIREVESGNDPREPDLPHDHLCDPQHILGNRPGARHGMPSEGIERKAAEIRGEAVKPSGPLRARGRGDQNQRQEDPIGPRSRKTGHLALPGLQSGRRDSNPRPPPWQGGALPSELRPHQRRRL